MMMMGMVRGTFLWVLIYWLLGILKRTQQRCFMSVKLFVCCLFSPNATNKTQNMDVSSTFNNSVNLHIVCREEKKKWSVCPKITSTEGFIHIPIINDSERMRSASFMLCITPLKSVMQILALHLQNTAMNTPPWITVSSGMQWFYE